MVANVRSESLRSISILRSFTLFSSSSSVKSVGDKLKKAISEPLANPETIKSNAANMAAIITPPDIVCKVISEKDSVMKDISN